MLCTNPENFNPSSTSPWSKARLRPPVKLAPTHQAASDVGGLQKGPFGRRMGRQIAGDSDEDVPALIAVSPFTKLPNARLEHLIGMKTCIFAKECPRKGRDKMLGRVTHEKMAGDEPCRSIDLVLTIEGIEQLGTDFLDLYRKVIELIATVARQRRWRHVQITSERAIAPWSRPRTASMGSPSSKSADPLAIRLRDW